jgi:hypothetical protein
VAVVDAGAIPRRVTPIDKASLARTDACSLLDAKALALVPGVDGNHPDVGFGDWTCGWDSTTGDLSVDLRFDRDQPLTAADGRPTRLAGHSGFIAAGDDGPDTCVARIVHRPYADPYGHPANELVILKVSGPSSPNDLCRLTIELARAAAGKLPRT